MTPQIQKLYKTDSKGKTRVWWAKTDQQHLIVSHGIDGGKIITETTTCQPVNVGKSNERDGRQQAEFECAALYKKKQDRDGYTTAPETQVDYIQPMLARDYSKVGHQVDWSKPTYGSYKMDGVRAIWVKGKGFQSRKGIFYKVPHLEDALKDVDHLLDGELYLHGVPLNQIVAAVKKPNKLTPKIEFHAFDVVTQDIDYDKRWDTVYLSVIGKHPQLKYVPQVRLWAQSDLHHYHQKYVNLGYEGIMIRQHGPYLQGQRAPTLYKYKEFEEAEFEIIGVKTDKHGQGILQCDGFDVRMRGTDEEREYQLQHPDEFIGKQVTVRYFTLTEYGKPQFPVGVCIRDGT